MTVLDRTFALLSLAAFGGFLGILIWFVPRPGLIVVCILCFIMCAFDFWRSSTARRRRERNYRREAGL